MNSPATEVQPGMALQLATDFEEVTGVTMVTLLAGYEVAKYFNNEAFMQVASPSAMVAMAAWGVSHVAAHALK